MSTLINDIVSKLGINEAQAQGGVGAILNFAKEQLAAGDFSKITSVIEGAETFMNAAPKTAGTTASATPALGGLFNTVTSALGINTGSVGAIVELVGKMDGLNIDKATVAKFLPIVMNYVEEKGGATAKNILANILK